MYVSDTKDNNVRSGLEQSERRNGVLGDLPLDEHEHTEGHNPKHDKTDHDRRVPGVRDAAVPEAEEEHDGGADAGEGAQPVHGQQTLDDGRLRRVHLEEEEHEDAGEPGDGEVYPETPPPGNELGEGPADDGPEAAGHAPGYAKEAVVIAAVTDRSWLVSHNDEGIVILDWGGLTEG